MLVWMYQFLSLLWSCLWNSIFNFLGQKNLFGPIFSALSHKNIFVFWYFHLITKFKFRMFIIIFCTKSIYALKFTSKGFTLIAVWYILFHSWNISANTLTDTFFWYSSHIFVDVTLQGSNKSFSVKFSFIICRIHFNIIAL